MLFGRIAVYSYQRDQESAGNTTGGIFRLIPHGNLAWLEPVMAPDTPAPTLIFGDYRSHGQRSA
ncbi:MAG: hypothetical protein WBW92_00740 [Rhodanobacteraceae bacterium]